ncbi:PQQ-dependent sugar dehydrogenase [Nonomuraea jiangxiensis]|uniref:Glucose/arabinose dehydrogenase, beta-propeller fold n=1 Tax=Nonomuraea jiangxiensis TaxID=633440 RepID=A0A1G8TT87_9ACTN|nr:PQQ-dependent sugar dehydrogenase [Nonomuraea jiangxiensis]SDJ44751.1 Glucose/arabinose dehydrogenase, beta-propeller fold [Nonomuraea jiangxiensis]
MPGKRWAAPVLLALSLPLLAPVNALTTPVAAATARTDSVQRSAVAATVPLEEVNTITTQVAFGLRRPTAIAAPDDGTNRLFITEKSGTVRVYHPDTGLAQAPIIDITASVDETGNERGLLGIALAPDFAASQDVYLAYTALPDGAVTLGRYRLDEARLEPLLSQEHSEYSNHNGGQITFGTDGYLYMSIGDGGAAGDPFDSGQRVDTLLGKILRVDVRRSCGALPYCVPRDNPFAGVAGADGRIWLYGGRNPWRFSIDPADGSMWVADVGQGSWEEINHLRPGRQAGANLGWSCYEGLVVFDETQCRSGVEYTMPIFTYSPHTGGCAVIGGMVYHGRRFADLVGDTYIATDYCSSTVWAVRKNAAGGYTTAEIGQTPTQVTAFGVTPEGEFYVVNDLPGGLHRVSFEHAKPTCRVAYKAQVWGGGMTVDLTITNLGTTPINGWTLRFPLARGQKVIGDWNTDLTQSGDIVNAVNAAHNGSIAPGRSVTLGYVADHTGDSSPPSRFSLNQDTCAVTR